MNDPSLEETLRKLSLLLQLTRRARKASEDELGFIMVNETRSLLPYRQAIFFKYKDRRLIPAAVSGLAVIDSSSPFIQWLARLAAARLADEKGWTAGAFSRDDLAGGPLFGEWDEKSPGQALWLPLSGSRDSRQGVLLFFRDQPFSPPEGHVLSYLADGYGQALSAWRPPGHHLWLSKLKRRWKILAAALIVLSFYPLQESVLAPAEVTAKNPRLVRSSLEGVVEKLLVKPNQEVKAGQVLAHLDDAQLRSRLAVARKGLEMARAEYRQTVQEALKTPEAKARLPLLKGRIEQMAAEASYVEDLLRRADIKSQSDGVAVFEDPNSWLGRPVAVGEKVMLVADPSQVELTMHLPIKESLPVEPGGQALFFANVAPGAPRKVLINYVGYQAGETGSAGNLAFTLRGDFDGQSDPPRLGLRGTAKIYGPRRPLILIALRQPIKLARQWLGW